MHLWASLCRALAYIQLNDGTYYSETLGGRVIKVNNLAVQNFRIKDKNSATVFPLFLYFFFWFIERIAVILFS